MNIYEKLTWGITGSFLVPTLYFAHRFIWTGIETVPVERLQWALIGLVASATVASFTTIARNEKEKELY